MNFGAEHIEMSLIKTLTIISPNILSNSDINIESVSHDTLIGNSITVKSGIGSECGGNISLIASLNGQIKFNQNNLTYNWPKNKPNINDIMYITNIDNDITLEWKSLNNEKILFLENLFSKNDMEITLLKKQITDFLKLKEDIDIELNSLKTEFSSLKDEFIKNLKNDDIDLNFLKTEFSSLKEDFKELKDEFIKNLKDDLKKSFNESLIPGNVSLNSVKPENLESLVSFKKQFLLMSITSNNFQLVNNTTQTVVNYENVIKKSDSIYVNDLKNIITIPETGFYRFTNYISYESGKFINSSCLLKNNTTGELIADVFVVGSMINNTSVFKCSKNDTISVITFQSNKERMPLYISSNNGATNAIFSLEELNFLN